MLTQLGESLIYHEDASNRFVIFARYARGDVLAAHYFADLQMAVAYLDKMERAGVQLALMMSRDFWRAAVDPPPPSPKVSPFVRKRVLKVKPNRKTLIVGV